MLTTGTQLSVLNAAGILGRLIAGYLVDYCGALNLSVFFLVGMGVITACMSLIRGTAGVMVFAIIYGLDSGGCGFQFPSLFITTHLLAL